MGKGSNSILDSMKTLKHWRNWRIVWIALTQHPKICPVAFNVGFSFFVKAEMIYQMAGSASKVSAFPFSKHSFIYRELYLTLNPLIMISATAKTTSNL